MRILVIDDNADLGAMLAEALTNAGYDARHAIDGQAAVRAFEAYGADVVVVDMFMPGMDGLELIARLKRRPGHRSMRIIGISGGGRSGDLDLLKMSSRLGAHATLSKPFKPSELIAKIEELTDAG